MADRRADQEKGAVLIAVNSYVNDPKHRLLYSDRVLKGYIETFYRYLFFQVDVVVDFTLVDFNGKLKEFTTWCRKNEMNRIAVVLYGHGGIVGGKECIFTNDFNPLEIAALEEELHNQLPDDNKYLFIDACRNSVSVQPYVFQANTDRTTVIRSTLLFKTAISNAWSECFAMNLRKQGALSIIVNNVDDNMKEKYTDDIRRKCDIPVGEGDQKSEIRCKGASDDPSFRGEARASNQERIRELTPSLQGHINVAEQSLTAMRTKLDLPPKPILSFLDSPTDDRSNLTGPGLALSSAQGLATANLPPHLPPVAPLSKQSNNPSKQPSAQANQAPHNPPFVAPKLGSPTDTDPSKQPAQVPDLPIPQAKQPPNNPLVASLGNPPDNPSNQPALDLPSAQGSTATRTVSKMDKKIASSLDIFGVDEYRRGFINKRKILGTVIGIGEDADAIVSGPGTNDDQLDDILKLYISKKTPTWHDFCTALKQYDGFNAVRAKIEDKHKL